MPAYYRASLPQFVGTSPSEIHATLADQNARASFRLEPEALFAWQFQLPHLQNAARWLLSEVADASSWSILLEYPVPRIGKRIDAILLAGDVIIVIETKTGASPTSAARQVDDYALNLACFHEASASAVIAPLVVADAQVSRRGDKTQFDYLIQPCTFASFADIGDAVRRIVDQRFGQFVLSTFQTGLTPYCLVIRKELRT